MQKKQKRSAYAYAYTYRPYYIRYGRKLEQNGNYPLRLLDPG